MAKMTKQRAKEFYATMYKIRRFEEEVFEFYKLGQMAGLAHLYIGEEAVAAGALQLTNRIISVPLIVDMDIWLPAVQIWAR